MTTISGSGAHASVAGTDRAPFSKAGTKGYHDVDALLAYARTVLLDDDDALAGDSDDVAATQAAVKAYIDTLLAAKAPLASPALTGTPTAPTAAAATNTTQIATTAMVQAAIAAYLALNDVERLKGAIDCSSNPNYPAADAGDGYRVSVAGKIGGASGVNVDVGDKIVCFTDSSASGNHATVGANWFVLNTNIDGAVFNTTDTSVADEDFVTFTGTGGKSVKKLAKGLVPQRLANITALRAATWTSALAPVVVILDRAWNVGDGGGGIFVLDSTDTTSADDHGTIILTSTSGTALRYKRVFGGPAKAEWFGAVGDGTTDDTTALTRALASAALIVQLRNRLDYLISSGVQPQSGGGFVVPPGSKGWLKAKTGSGGFNNKSMDGTRTDADRCMFRCTSGLDDLVLDNVGFKTDGGTEVCIYPIRTSGAGQTKGLNFRGLAFKGFAMGELIGLNSLTGENRIVQVDYFRDCGATQGTSYWSGSAPRSMACVVIDNDIVSSTPSKPIRLDIGDIYNVIHSSTALTDFGGETDGVTVVAHGANTSSGHIINIGSIDTIGEAIDIQGHHCQVRIGRIKNAYNDAVKLIHGPCYNTIDVGEIEASGRSAVAIWGSNSSDAAGHAIGNVVRVRRVTLPGTYGLGTTASNVCVVLFGQMTQTSKPKSNEVFIDSFDGDGTNLDYGVYCGDAGQGLTTDVNVVEIGRGTGWATASSSAAPANVKVRCKARSRTKMALSGNQTVTTATATKLAFAESVTDDESAADTSNNKIVIKWPGYYQVRIRTRMDSWENATTDQFILELRQNNSAIEYAKDHIHFGSKDMIARLDTTVYVDENDIGTGAAELTAYFTHDCGADRTITDNNFMTYFEAVRLN